MEIYPANDVATQIVPNIKDTQRNMPNAYHTTTTKDHKQISICIPTVEIQNLIMQLSVTRLARPVSSDDISERDRAFTSEEAQHASDELLANKRFVATRRELNNLKEVRRELESKIAKMQVMFVVSACYFRAPSGARNSAAQPVSWIPHGLFCQVCPSLLELRGVRRSPRQPFVLRNVAHGKPPAHHGSSIDKRTRCPRPRRKEADAAGISSLVGRLRVALVGVLHKRLATPLPGTV